MYSVSVGVQKISSFADKWSMAEIVRKTKPPGVRVSQLTVSKRLTSRSAKEHYKRMSDTLTTTIKAKVVRTPREKSLELAAKPA